MKKIVLLLSFLAASVSLPAAVAYTNSLNPTHRTVQKLDDKKSMRKHKKEMKKELRKELKKMRKSQRGTDSKGLSIAAVVLLGILAIVGWFLLFFILEYSLGYTSLFIALLLLGWAAIIIGVVLIIKKIRSKQSP